MSRILLFQTLPLRILCWFVLGAGAMFLPVFRNDCFGQTPVSQLERSIFVGSADVSTTILGDSTIFPLLLSSFTTATLTIVSIQCPTLVEHIQFLNVQGLQIQAMQRTTATVIFRPQSLIKYGVHALILTVRLPSGELQSATFANVLYVSGSLALKLIPPPQQVAPIDSTTLIHATLINRWREPIQIDSAYLRPYPLSDTNTLGFALPPLNFLPRTLLPNDTLRLPILIQPKNVRTLYSDVFVSFRQTNGQAVTRGFLQAIGINLNPPRSIPFQMTTRFIPDSASPGDTVICEISLAEGNKRDLFRNAEPHFSLNLEFDKTLLQVMRGYGSDVSPDPKSRLTTFQITNIFWDGRADVVAHMPFIVMASDTMRTTARVANVFWGTYIFYNFLPSLNNTPLNVSTCLAGGPRLFRFGKPTALTLEQVFPNPGTTSFEVRYSLTESENVEIALFTSDGKLVRTIASGVHATGTYTVAMETSTLPTGAYFLRLSSESGIQQMPVNIVH